MDRERIVRVHHPVDYIHHLRATRGEAWWAARTGEDLECTQQAGDLSYVPNSYQV